MKQSTLKKLGILIYHLYTLKSEELTYNEYNRILKTVSDALLDIAPVERHTRVVNQDFEDIINKTNRRLSNG